MLHFSQAYRDPTPPLHCRLNLLCLPPEVFSAYDDIQFETSLT